jgi:hypothetical protein
MRLAEKLEAARAEVPAWSGRPSRRPVPSLGTTWCRSEDATPDVTGTAAARSRSIPAADVAAVTTERTTRRTRSEPPAN